MAISARPYQGETDLRRIQAATAEWIASAGFLGYMNVSDIALRLFNGMRRYQPNEIVRLWEDDAGEVIGWAMAYPGWSSFEVLLRPDFRQSQLADDIIDWAERETISQMTRAGLDSAFIRLDVFDGDSTRIDLLERRGYTRGNQSGTISICSLEQPLPPVQLPTGFSIRSLQGTHEADKLVSITSDSFGWTWTVEACQQIMCSPGYDVENEWVVVAPDGRFAASSILLPDVHNRTVMFENVGTGRDVRRLGLAKAMLIAGMERMKTRGFTMAMVPHGAGLEAAAALYASVGFRPAYTLIEYTRPVK